jgi:hypothetical protein
MLITFTTAVGPPFIGDIATKNAAPHWKMPHTKCARLL